MTLPPLFLKKHLDIVLINFGYEVYSEDVNYLHYINKMDNVLTIPQKDVYCDKLLGSILKQANIPEIEFMDKVNIYIKPSAKNSLVAFVDVLGFTKRMENITDDEKMKDFLIHYKKVVGLAYGELEKVSKSKRNARINEISYANKMSYAKIFSDNILYMNELTKRDGERDFVDFLDQIALYQLNLVLDGFPSRGAIVAGDMYCDGTLIVGNPIVKAYDIEKNKAKHPKIVIDDSTFKEIRKFLRRYRTSKNNIMTEYIVKEDKGPFFLNYLYYLISQEEIDPEDINEYIIDDLLNHKNLICENLKKFKNKKEMNSKEVENNQKIYEKYEWLAEYHNYFCSTYIPCSEKVLIPDTTRKFKFICVREYYTKFPKFFVV